MDFKGTERASRERIPVFNSHGAIYTFNSYQHNRVIAHLANYAVRAVAAAREDPSVEMNIGTRLLAEFVDEGGLTLKTVLLDGNNVPITDASLAKVFPCEGKSVLVISSLGRIAIDPTGLYEIVSNCY